MKKFTYVLAVSIIIGCVCGFTFKKENLKLLPTQKENILSDLLKLQYDLRNNPDCIRATAAMTAAKLKEGRMNFNTTLKYPATDSSHYGVICINDIINMLLENDANIVNNSIVYYPVIDKTTSQPGIVCIGAQLIEYPDKTSEVKMSSTSKHYSSNWCPEICPKNADAGLRH